MENMVSFDGKSYKINGARIWLTSGEMHYFRIPAGLWRDRLCKAKRAGLNCISTYMAWNVHEPWEGKFDFSGDKDIGAFIRLAGEIGLYVILRPGPYICSEWDFGGFPPWLANKEGIHYRGDHAAYSYYYKRFFMQILPALAKLDAAHGGNIILIQNENEHLMPCVPGRMAYFGEISRCFREAGFLVPIINCNRLFEGKTEAGTVECVNTWDDPLGDIARMRSVQPEAPILVTEFWCGGLDSWGRRHQTKEPCEVARKAMEMLGSGAQYNYYMWHGGTNFAFWGGRLQYEPFYHVITSYDLDSPLAEGGGLTEKYYATKIVNMLSDTMGRFFSGAAAKMPETQGTSGIKRLELHGPEGSWITLTNGGNRKASIASLELENGTGLEISLEPFGAAILPVNVKLTGSHVLNYSNLTPLGYFGESILVLHGPEGRQARLCINGQEKSERIPEGGFPTVIDFDGLPVVLVGTALAGRCWWVDGKLIIGPDHVGETAEEICPGPEGALFYEIQPETGLRALKVTAAKKTAAAVPRLDRWKTEGVCLEPCHHEMGWTRLEAPCDMPALGVPYGYGWYRVTVHVDEDRQYGLYMPESQDRLTIYHNGRYAGTWGYGPEAVRTPLPVLMKKGRNVLIILADNLGRFCHSWRLGERKGIYGHIFDAVPLKAEPVVRMGGEFDPSMIPCLPGHLNEDHYVAELRSKQLWTGSAEFDLNEMVPVHGSYTGRYSVLVLCNGQVAGFYENPGQGFAEFLLKDQLKTGRNTIKFLMWGDVDGNALADVRLHALRSNISEDGLWEFKPWTYPPELPKDSREAEMMPAWFRTTFKGDKLSGPLYLKINGAWKGQIYLNGHNAGRYWTVGPQDTYYLPECWLIGENELLLFDEKGISPQGSELVTERSWKSCENVRLQLDVL